MRVCSRRLLLRFSRRRWADLIAGLGQRGGNVSESGAFLLARRAARKHEVVAKIVFFDDLDAGCGHGGIHLDWRAFTRLAELCDVHQLRVIGDVHTHPGAWVDQSGIDRDNPLIARVGHVAVIVPDLASQPVRVVQVGVHEYQGEDGWRSYFGEQAASVLRVSWWR
jgi:hypothetical protein